MEQDFDRTHWETPCKKCNCKKPVEGLKYVSVPASLTSEYAPRNGLYSNAIVKYEETGAVYIFSAEGIPVLVKEGN